MKFIWLFIFVFLMINNTYTAVKTHNFTIQVGAKFTLEHITPNFKPFSLIPSNITENMGGGFRIELGYLYLNRSVNLQGLEINVVFAMDFLEPYSFGGSRLITNVSVGLMKIENMSFFLSTVYSAGNKFISGSLLIDILGVDIGYFTGKEMNFLQNISSSRGDNLLLGITLPLGVKYIFDEGIFINLRHVLNINFSFNDGIFGIDSSKDLYFSHKVIIGVGFVWGGKKIHYRYRI